MEKEPTIFDFLNAINSTKKDFDDIYFVLYKPFVINRYLSYSEDTAIIANEMNMCPDMPAQAQFYFLRSIIRKRKRFSTWIKSVKDMKIGIIQKYYQYSHEKATEVADLLSEAQIETLEKRMSTGGK